MNGDIVNILKDIRNLILSRFITELAADREYIATWLQSNDMSIDTGDIAPGSSVQYVLPVPEGQINTVEKLSWKIDEWWITTIQWYRDGVKVYEETNTVDGETNTRIAPARDSTYIVITNNSSTNTARLMIRWHYAFANRELYESFMTGIVKEATEIIKEVAGIRGE